MKKDELLKLPSILEALSIEFRTALTRNARAKGKALKGGFRTVKGTFLWLYDGYTGETILERPDELAVKNMSMLELIDDFKRHVDTYITS